MELAGRIFDVVTREDKLTDAVRDLVPRGVEFAYWRSVLRMAALCHDIGHLPFSHAAEEELLPEGWDHEEITRSLIFGDEMKAVWEGMRPVPKPEDVCKLALGPKKVKDLAFNSWEAILSEMIVGEAFGADRMDYLLRDSLHLGVAYGRFDHDRLIATMRIIPVAGSPDDSDTEPALGVERGGLESAEALLLARYFMFSQVYFHPTRLIYDEHLKDFLKEWLSGDDGRFRTDPEEHLRLTDNEVMGALLVASRNLGATGHEPARRIVERQHFRVLYSRSAKDVEVHPEAASAVFEAAKIEFGEDNVKYADSRKAGSVPDFPVLDRDGSPVSALWLSAVFERLPSPKDEYVYVAPEIRDDAELWLKDKRQEIIEQAAAKEQEQE